MEWSNSVWSQAILPNLFRTPREALQAFDYLANSSSHVTTMQRLAYRYMGAVSLFALWQIKTLTRGMILKRQTVYDEANKWADALQGQDFMGMCGGVRCDMTHR